MPPPAGKGYNRPGLKGKAGAHRHGPPPGKGYLREGFAGVGPNGTPGQPAGRVAASAADNTEGLHPEVDAIVKRNQRNQGVM